MDIVNDIAAMQSVAAEWQRQAQQIAVVPTMGYLHQGHTSLIKLARERADRVVVTLFVNPTQFGEGEDLDQYPRNFERDRAMCAAHGADVLFAPTDMYPPESSTWVEETAISRWLCGRSRPGHFRGVTTIVAKLFLATRPDLAIFGQKDAQQVLVLKRMVRDLNFPVEIVVAPIVREEDGLAMSSRNAYLTADERKQAVALSGSLRDAKTAYEAGERDGARIRDVIMERLNTCSGEIDYAECVDAVTLEPISGPITAPVLCAVAVRFGGARLIDNCILPSGETL